MAGIRKHFRWMSLAAIVGVGGWLLLAPEFLAEDEEASEAASGERAEGGYVIRFSPGQAYMPDSVPYDIGAPLQGLKQVIRDFEARFPDTRIEVVNTPGVREYLVTQLSSGNAPEIVNVNVEDVWIDVQKGWYVPLDRFLEAPNAFVREQGDPEAPGYAAWWDMFAYQAISRGKAAPDNKNYCITFDMIETGVFYNKRIFREAGIAPPETWDQWMRDMEKLRTAGYIPMLVSIDSLNGWGTDLIFDQLYYELLPGIDLYQDPVREAYLEGYLDWDEICFLFQQGFFGHDDPRYREVWRVMYAFRQHCNQNLSGTDFIREFVTQQGAMFWGTSPLTFRLSADRNLGFEWGVFYPPRFTKATSPYASGVEMCVIGGSATQLEVTNSAIDDTDPTLPMEERIGQSKKLGRVIAFLQFLTVRENYERIVLEYPCFVPNIVGVPVLAPLQPFAEILERRYTTAKWLGTFDLRFSEIQRRMLELYLNDGIDLDGFMDWQVSNLDAATRNLLIRKDIDLERLRRSWEALAPARSGPAWEAAP